MSLTRIEFRANRWIRHKDELVISFALEDYPAIRKKNYVKLEPGMAAIFHHGNGNISVHPEIKFRIPRTVTHLSILCLDTFQLSYEFENQKILLSLRFQQISPALAFDFTKKLRYLLKRRPQVFIKDIFQEAETFIKQRIFTGDISQDPSKQQYELIRFFEQFALEIEDVEITEITSHRNSLCAESQNTDTGYFVFLRGMETYDSIVFPLTDGEYLIARASDSQTLVQYLNFKEDLKKTPIWFPKHPGPSTIVRVARVLVENNIAVIYSGWPASYSHEKITLQGRQERVEVKLRQGEQYRLNGFEHLEFHGEPKIELLYIPPITEYTGILRHDLLTRLEHFGLWAIAAHGWHKLGDNEQALSNLRQALDCAGRTGGNHLEQFNILMFMSRVLASSGNTSDKIELVQKQAFELMDLPVLEVFVQGKVGVQDKPLRLSIHVHNKSTKHSAHNINISYKCYDQGIYHRGQIDTLRPHHESYTSFMVSGLQKAGKHPVNMRINFSTSPDNYFELWLSDFIEVTKRRSHIDIEGDVGLVSVQIEDQELAPDIRVGRDAGAVIVKMIQTGEPHGTNS
jgi:hypothetical protein